MACKSKTIEFVAFCFEQYKKRHHLDTDQVMDLFEKSGFINKSELINELKAYKLVDQVLFHTEKALECLRFCEAIKV